MRASLALAFASASFFLAPSGHAQSRKLSAPLPRAVLGDVLEQHFSPDGNWVVFRADRDRDEVVELWSVLADGSGPELEISGPMPDSGDVLDFRIAPDSATVVYRADQDADDVFELWRAPIGAPGGAEKIAPTLLPEGDVQADYAVDPGAQRVLYRVTYLEQPFQELHRLMSVNLADAPVPVDLLATLGSNGTIRAFRLSADGAHVLFVASQPTEGNWLVRRDLAGAEPAEILFAPPLSTIQSDLTSTADGSRILFRLTQSNGTTNLWSLPADGSSAPVALSRLAGTRRGILRFQAAHEGGRVVYIADQDTFDKYELYSAPDDGSSEPLKLSGTLASNAQVNTGHGFNADGSRYVYRRDSLVSGAWAFDLFSVPSDGSALATHLAGPPGLHDGPFYAAVSPTGRVVYANLNVPRSLASVPIDGSAAPLVLDQLLSCTSFELVGGGDTVLYASGCGGVNSAARLVQAPVDGSTAPVELESGSAHGAAGAWELDATDERVLYRRTDPGSDVARAWVATRDGSAPNLLLNAPFPSNAFVGSVGAFAASDERAAYVMNTLLFGVGVLGESEPVELAPRASSPQVTPDGERLLFVEWGSGLYAVPLDGSAAPLELSSGLASQNYVWNYRLSPDGSRVAFLSESNGTRQLYLSPTDGSAPAVSLSGALVSRGTVHDYRFTSDGARVVYRADQLVDEAVELFSADGTGPAVRLNPALPVSADIADFRLSANGARVVFPSYAPLYQLMSAPVDGSSAAMPIAFPASQYVRFEVHPLAPEVVYQTVEGIFRTPDDAVEPVTLTTFDPVSGRRDLVDLQLTSDGTRVVYVADQLVNDEFELFSVPFDGSAPPVELSLVVAAGGDVLEFQLTPDGARVVYRADQGVNERYDVYSVPIDTRAGLQKLDPQLQAGRDVTHFRISPDGAFVAYRADQDLDDVFELFAAPIGGRREAVKLHHALARGGAASSFVFTPDGRQVLFLLDRAAPLAFELHAAWVPGRARLAR